MTSPASRRALGLERLHVVGWSGGGPHALASAARLRSDSSDRPRRSPAWLRGRAEGLDWLDGMADENREEFGAAVEGADALTAFLGKQPADAARRCDRPRRVAEALGGLVTEVDRRALSRTRSRRLSGATVPRRRVSQGIWGWLDDDLAFARDWGFSLGEISVPVTVWQGRHDAMVPYAHGEWLTRNVPGARAKLLDDEGHLSLALRFGDVVDDLLAG